MEPKIRQERDIVQKRNPKLGANLGPPMLCEPRESHIGGSFARCLVAAWRIEVAGGRLGVDFLGSGRESGGKSGDELSCVCQPKLNKIGPGSNSTSTHLNLFGHAPPRGRCPRRDGSARGWLPAAALEDCARRGHSPVARAPPSRSPPGRLPPPIPPIPLRSMQRARESAELHIFGGPSLPPSSRGGWGSTAATGRS